MKQPYSTNGKLGQIYAMPPLKKFLIMLSLCLFLIFVGYFIDSRLQLNKIKQSEKKELLLKKNFEAKQQEYETLKHVYKKTQIMQNKLQQMLLQLPTQTNIHDVLENITNIVSQEGLKLVYFKPQEIKIENYFVITPIKLAVLGGYHQMGKFISKVADMNHLILIEDFTLERKEENSDNLTLQLAFNLYSFKVNEGIIK